MTRRLVLHVMARGKFKGKPKRGGGKHFSRNLAPLGPNGEEPDVESSTPDKWDRREPKGEGDSDESSEEEESEEESEEEEADASKKPVVTTENPNHVKKGPVKATAVKGPPQELTRREREALEAAAAKERYWKLQEAGKTDQARADLARLSIIRKEREEKAKQRQAEADAKVEAAKAKLENSGRKK